MDMQRGILFLYDPEQGGTQLPRFACDCRTDTQSVRYSDAAQCISDAQSMLYPLRQRFERNCIAAEGRACCIALALAAQLMVDRIVLCGPNIFAAHAGGGSRQLKRIEDFAIRNMSLVTSEIVLIDADGVQMRALIRMLSRYARGNVRIADAADFWETDEIGLKFCNDGRKERI